MSCSFCEGVVIDGLQKGNAFGALVWGRGSDDRYLMKAGHTHVEGYSDTG